MFATVFTLLALVAIGSSQQCCMEDKKFTIGMGGYSSQVLGGVPNGVQLYFQTAVDYTGRHAGGEGFVTVLGNSPIAVKFIQVWSQKTQYTIINEDCTVTALTTPEPNPCVPSSATFLSYIVEGNNEFVCQTWQLDPSYVGLMDGVAYYTLSNITCIPTAFGYMGTVKTDKGPVPSVVHVGYFNYSSGIPDPKRWFDIPSSCTQDVGNHKMKRSSTVPVHGITTLLHNLIF